MLKSIQDVIQQHCDDQKSSLSFEKHANKVQVLTRVPQGAKAWYVASAWINNPQPILWVLPDARNIDSIYQDLCELVSEENVLIFPEHDLNPYEYKALSLTWEEDFGLFAKKISKVQSEGRPYIILTTLQRSLERHSFKALSGQVKTLDLVVGKEYDPNELSQWLRNNGYEEVSMVEGLGEFSQRGGIIDFYPFEEEEPIRLDFFGDELESIRYFDLFSQRSTQKLSAFQIKELGPLRPDHMTLDALGKKLATDPRYSQTAKRKYSEGCLISSEAKGLFWLRSYLDKSLESIYEFLPGANLFVDEPDKIEIKFGQLHEEVKKGYESAEIYGAHPKELWQDKNFFENQKNSRAILFYSENQWAEGKLVSPDIEAQKRGSIALNELIDVVESWQSQNYRVLLLSSSRVQTERYQEYLSDLDEVEIIEGSLSSGWIDHTQKLAVLTDHQLFNKVSRRKHSKKYKGNSVSLTDFSSLERGDYVLHQDYGLGQFGGLTKVDVEGAKTDCLLVNFNGKDRLTIPVSDFYKLEKYSPKEGIEPKLDKLGGKSWDNLKQKVAKKVVQIAQELVELYAKRSVQKGFAFPPDDRDQELFEEEFPYPPTQDQINATRDCKSDMESSRPMDRLVCGDVGFGKTEVAMRCAFKAVHAGKQVAVLVPTTILAAQHFENFCERFSSWPIKIEMLSRYRTAKEKKEIFEKVSRGQIDILVGTHALITQKLKFKDLGLFIIDEEQKFGVKQKEKLREIRLNIDTLALSATPIPRTLHLSLTGVRDISTISTPPRNRLPVETKWLEFDGVTLGRAIKAELDRGGQIFLVNNHIKELEELARQVRDWVPDIRMAIAHGQLPEHELERVMSAFVYKEYDLLLSTNIVESGIDISNANTIIIHNAHHFGMSQLYQLRGRVGRGELHAHAYLVTPRGLRLREDTKHRLQSLERHTELGSGFKIAMRDLEIRGAGNLLGMEQSGFIDEIGYDTYLRLVQEAVRNLKGEVQRTDIETKTMLEFDAFLPESYIEDGIQRLNIYQRLARALSCAEIENLKEELEDRFGKLPDSVLSLIYSMDLRILGGQLGLKEIRQEGPRWICVFDPSYIVSPKVIEIWIKKSAIPIQFSYNNPIEVILNIGELEHEYRILQTIKSSFQEIAQSF